LNTFGQREDGLTTVIAYNILQAFAEEYELIYSGEDKDYVKSKKWHSLRGYPKNPIILL
jgi:hypothetical protein